MLRVMRFLPITILLLFLLLLLNNNKQVSASTLVVRGEEKIDVDTNAEEQRLCRYRNEVNLLPETLFRHLTGASCYIYTNKAWLTQNDASIRIQHVTFHGKQLKIPSLLVGDDKVEFDYLNTTTCHQYIRPLFKQQLFFDKWQMCARTADECCKEQLNVDNVYASSEYPCPALWDGFTCYNQTKAMTTVYQPCPLYTTASDSFVCNLQSEKYCLSTGWNHSTNYLVCSSSLPLRKRHTFHLIALLGASVIMTPSVIIYYTFVQPWQQQKHLMHCILITAILIKNILVIISKKLIILDAIEGGAVMDTNAAWCRCLSFAENLSKNLIFTAMGGEAVYLHKIITQPWTSSGGVGVERKAMFWYMLAAIIGGSLCPTILSVTLMHCYGIQKCWMALDDTAKWIQWTTDSYKYLMLAINAAILCNITRVVCLKMRNSENQKQRNTSIKVPIILLFLFGIPLIISSQRQLVDMSDCVASAIYHYVTYSIEAGQGVFLAIYFCYCNGEVHTVLFHRFTIIETKFRERYGMRHRRRTTTVGVPLFTTFTSVTPPHQDDDDF